MSLRNLWYGNLSFPCSRHGVKVPDNTFEARMLITSCNVERLAGLGRPADEKIRDLWISRFVNEMHWLPLIEVLIGCDRSTNPKGNAAFLTSLKAANPLRVCHRPWGRFEISVWAYKLENHIQKVCPEPRIVGLVKKRLGEVRAGGDVFFVSADAEAAATLSQASDQTWVINSWVHYRQTRMGNRPLSEDERKAFVLGTLDPSDAAAQACKEIR